MADPGPASPPPVALLSRPSTYYGRVIVFLILCGIAVAFLRERIVLAFLANPILNAVIIVALVSGIFLAFRALWQVSREVRWGNSRLSTDAPLSRIRPYLLAPLEGVFTGTIKRLAPLHQRSLLESFDARLHESREILRYLAGLLVFLGLLGTFWGLIETVGSVGNIINNLNVGGDADSVFNTLKEGLAAPLGGMGISFSSSLFGLAGSLILGFLDLQTSQAQNRFYTNLEDWLATTVEETGAAGLSAGSGPLPASITEAIERLRYSVNEAGSGKATTAAMANLAEAIQGLVQHMRAEQQMIRDWADAQAKLNNDIRRFMEILSREAVDR